MTRFARVALLALASALAVAPPAVAAGHDRWKDQIVMTTEVAKYASAELDGDLAGDDSAGSNDIDRFQFAFDDPFGQPPFFQGSGLFGGDLIGLRNHAAHLRDLGATATILYPVMRSDKQDFFSFLPTGYGITDYQAVDPNFGTAADYEAAVRALQSSGVKVLQDLALALVGHEHPWFTPVASAANVDRFRRWDPTTVENNSGSDGSGSTTFSDILEVDLASAFDVDAFSSKRAPGDGDFDGHGNTLPAEGTGASFSAPVGFDSYLSFVFGSKLRGRASAVSGSTAGDVALPLPDRRYATLTLALAAVDGSQNATFRVDYADGTHTDTQATVQRWDPPAPPFRPLKQFPVRHTPDGPVAQPVYLYGLTLNTDPTRRATGIRLLAGAGAAKVRVVSLTGLPVGPPVKLDLSEYYDTDGIASSADRGDGDLDLLFPTEGFLRPLTPAVVGMFPATSPSTPAQTRFGLGPFQTGRDNLVRAQGQEIPVDQARYHYFRVAAFASSAAAATGDATVTYTDGTTTVTPLSVKPLTAAAEPGDVLVHQGEFAQRRTATGWVDDTSVQPKLWGYQVAADWRKTVRSITLPDRPAIHVAAVDPVILIDNGFGAAMLDHRDPETYDYLLDTVRHWMDSGLDGLRIDSVQKYFPEVFRRLERDLWKRDYHGKWMLGEAAVAEPTPGAPAQEPLPWQLRRQQYVDRRQRMPFDGVYDFETADALRATFGKQADATSGAFSLVRQSVTWDRRYERPWNQAAFFDVYENFPFIDEATGSEAEKAAKLRLAAAYLFAINRVPLLFSGNEYLLEYGQGAAPGSDARKPGYLFSPAVQEDPVLQDNHRYVRALTAMRTSSDALRSAERMTRAKWFVQTPTRFGFVRRSGSETVVALFNNSAEPAGPFTARLPHGTRGGERFNYVARRSDGGYGADDPAVSWPKPRTLRVAAMRPWEAKIVRIRR